MQSRDSLSEIISLVQNKKVLFITTKNLDYIRINQEYNLLKKYAKECDVIGINSRSYPKRILNVCARVLFKPIKCYDIIFIGFMPQLVVPLFKWKFRDKVVLIDFFISIYDTLVDDRKKVRDGGICSNILKRIDKSTLMAAAHVIVDTAAHGEYFVEEFGVEYDKIKVWYLEADTTLYYPRIVKRPDYLEGKFIVLYFGSILPVQGIEVIMNAITRLSHEKDIHFVIVGPIKKGINKTLAENVTYINWLPQEQLAKYISFADLCLAGHFSNTVGKANRTIPGKVYIYLAMKKKIILGDSQANHELFDESNRNDIIYVERGNADALAYAIMLEKEKTNYVL